MESMEIKINVPRETYENIKSGPGGASSAQIKSQINSVLAVQQARFAGLPIRTNSEMTVKEVEKHCKLDDSAEELIKNAMIDHGLSGRGYHKILKLGRTIADLAGTELIGAQHIAEAISYRVKSGDETVLG